MLKVCSGGTNERRKKRGVRAPGEAESGRELSDGGVVRYKCGVCVCVRVLLRGA